ncbi:NACHT domain-containing protein [Umezawaea sp. NPDC059074]|uniref:NACHT domain-containing protein n=1 Tax=Umezawaea sp. NPDC059074 TaxID=3346716 RepID=UPI0036C3C95C
MTGDDSTQSAGVHNELQRGEFVVQARDVYGGITLHTAAPGAPWWEVAAAELANMVEARARDEIAARDLVVPAPLPVQWDVDVSDPAPSTDAVVDMSCAQADVSELASMFLSLPVRRLMLLGGAGAGKSTLAVLLVRCLLAVRQQTDPVPVLFSMASWDPKRECLDDWLIQQLKQNYPLSDTGYGRDVAEYLVRDRHILPVLDGLDEVVDGADAALVALNTSLLLNEPVVVTCRVGVYEAASDPGSNGSGMHAATVLRVRPLDPVDVANYLRSAARSRRQLSQWQPLIDRLEEADPTRSDPLITALSSPLLVWLARMVCESGRTEPGDLANPTFYPTAESITHHLLDGLVPAAFRDLSPPRYSGRRHRCTADQARHWLKYLARATTPWHGNRINAVRLDFRHLAIQRLPRLSWSFFVLFTMSIFVEMCIYGRFSESSLKGLICGCSFSMATTETVYQVFGVPAVRRASWSPRDAFSIFRLLHQFPSIRLMSWTVAVILTIGLLRNFRNWVWLVVLAGSIVIMIVKAALIAGALTPPVVRPLGGQFAQVRALRNWMLLDILIFSSLSAVLAGAIGASSLGLSSGVVIGVWAWVGSSAWTAVFNIWTYWQWSRLVLFLFGRMPWSPLEFLDECARRGILREVGGSYQFCHDLLRVTLAGEVSVSTYPLRSRLFKILSVAQVVGDRGFTLQSSRSYRAAKGRGLSGLYFAVAILVSIWVLLLTDGNSGPLFLVAFVCLLYSYGFAIVGGFSRRRPAVMQISTDQIEVTGGQRRFRIHTDDVSSVVIRRSGSTALRFWSGNYGVYARFRPGATPNGVLMNPAGEVLLFELGFEPILPPGMESALQQSLGNRWRGIGY